LFARSDDKFDIFVVLKNTSPSRVEFQIVLAVESSNRGSVEIFGRLHRIGQGLREQSQIMKAFFH